MPSYFWGKVSAKPTDEGSVVESTTYCDKVKFNNQENKHYSDETFTNHYNAFSFRRIEKTDMVRNTKYLITK